MRHVVVLAGGDPVEPSVRSLLPSGAFVIAADSGLAHAQRLGLHVDEIVGDFDSADPAEVDAAIAAGAHIERHPTAKDATDLELALDAALELQPARILVLAHDSGRLDHLLSALLLLGSDKYADVELDATFGQARVTVVRGSRVLEGERGALISLLALHGPAESVHTDGLAYALKGETLEPGSSRGVSNAFVADTARIRVERGVLVAVQPGPENGGATR